MKTMKFKSVKQTKPLKTLRGAKDEKIEIYGNDSEQCFKNGNRVKINDRSNLTGKYRIGSITMLLVKGRIKQIKSARHQSRPLFKM